jgi:hypothetical protein
MEKTCATAIDKPGRRITSGRGLGCGMCRERFSPVWLNSVSEVFRMGTTAM